jgi:hypothetical protein
MQIKSQQSGGHKISDENKLLLKFLTDKDNEQMTCLTDTVSKSREAMAAP